MKKLRLRLARWIAPRGYAVGALDYRIAPPDVQRLMESAAIEADGQSPRWTPKQEGGVVVVEPLMVSKARRAGENVDDVS